MSSQLPGLQSEFDRLQTQLQLYASDQKFFVKRIQDIYKHVRRKDETPARIKNQLDLVMESRQHTDRRKMLQGSLQSLENRVAQVSGKKKQKKRLLHAVTRQLENLSIDTRNEADLVRNITRYVKYQGTDKPRRTGNTNVRISQPPLRKIFDVDVDLDGVDRTDPRLQHYIFEHFEDLAWETAEVKGKDGDCTNSDMHPSQKFAYHYFTPFNPMVHGFGIFHTAGSGKTISAMMSASVFMRAGYKLVGVGPSNMLGQKTPYLEEAFLNSADVNIQQYLEANQVRDLLEAYNREKKLELDRNALKSDANVYGDFLQFAFQIWKDMGIRFKYSGGKNNSLIPYEKMANIINQGEVFMTRTQVEDSQTISPYFDTRGSGGFIEFWFNIKNRKKCTEFQKANGDFWHKALVVLDEAHMLVPDDVDRDKTASVVLLQQQFWKSRELSKDECVKVMLLTATPINSYPTDLINLVNLLVPKEQSIQLLDSADFETAVAESKYYYPGPKDVNKGRAYRLNYSKWREKMNINFDRRFPFNEQTEEFSGEDQLRTFFAGYISYLNSQGNINTFARPFNEERQDNKPYYFNVRLTEEQETGIKECFTKAQVVYDDDTGTWKYEDTTPENNTKTYSRERHQDQTTSRRSSKKKRKQQSYMDKIYATEDDDDDDDDLDDGYDYDDEDDVLNQNPLHGVKEPKVLKRCVQRSLVFPGLLTKRIDDLRKKLAKLDRREGFEGQMDFIGQHSELLSFLVRNIQTAQQEDDMKGEEINRNNPGVDMPRKRKHIIYVDDFDETSKLTATNKTLQAVAVVLQETLGFRCVNFDLNGPRFQERKHITKMDDERQWKRYLSSQKSKNHNDPDNFRLYHNLVIFNNQTTDEVKDAVIDIFNHKDNIDGRYIAMILYDGNFKTGTSMKHVGHIHIYGVLNNDTDLKQAVARGLRFCGHRGVPITSRLGWQVNLWIYRPYFAHNQLFGNTRKTLQDVLESVSGVDKILLKKNRRLMQLMRECAVDRGLTFAVNNESDNITASLKTEQVELRDANTRVLRNTDLDGATVE